MSLINQMLRDLEQRRTSEVGSSALGGLSANGSAMQSVNISINYTTLAMLLVGLFVTGVVVAYLLGSQQQAGTQIRTIENIAASTSEKMTLTSVEAVEQNPSVVRSLPMQVQPATTPTPTSASEVEVAKVEAVVVATLEDGKRITKKPVAKIADNSVEKQPVSMSVKPAINASEAMIADEEQDINKTIRPLTEKEQSQLAFQRAVKMLGRSNLQGAQIALEAALSFAPTHIRARETLAALLLNQGRVSEAAGSLRDGLQLMPGAARLAKVYARILVDQADIPAAVNVLERARPAVSADPEYYALLAALYRQEKKHAQAAQVYQQILIQRPGVASWWMGLALSRDAMGENKQSLDAFQRAIRAGGLNAEITKYIRSRIVALMPIAVAPVSTSSDFDEFGE